MYGQMSTRTGVLSDLVREHELSDTAAAILILAEAIEAGLVKVVEELQNLRAATR